MEETGLRMFTVTLSIITKNKQYLKIIVTHEAIIINDYLVRVGRVRYEVSLKKWSRIGTGAAIVCPCNESSFPKY